MSPENYVLLLVGFVFGLLPRIAESRDSERRQKKRALTKLRRVLEDLFIQIEVSKAFRQAGGLQTMQGLFDLDESWAWRIPVAPPVPPADFDNVIDEVLEWETIYGRYDLSRLAISLKAQLEHAAHLYEILSNVAKNEVNLPERPIAAYTSTLEHLKESCLTLLNQVDNLCSLPHRKVIAKIKQSLFRPSSPAA